MCSQCSFSDAAVEGDACRFSGAERKRRRIRKSVPSATGVFTRYGTVTAFFSSNSTEEENWDVCRKTFLFKWIEGEFTSSSQGRREITARKKMRQNALSIGDSDDDSSMSELPIGFQPKWVLWFLVVVFSGVVKKYSEAMIQLRFELRMTPSRDAAWRREMAILLLSFVTDRQNGQTKSKGSQRSFSEERPGKTECDRWQEERRGRKPKQASSSSQTLTKERES